MPTYSFLDVQASMIGPGGTAVFGGQGGVAKEGITVEWTEDWGTMTVGAGGEAMHSLHAARPGRATVRLLKTSPINAIFSSMAALQGSNPALWGHNIVQINDLSRGDVITGIDSAFVKPSAITYAEDGNMNEWSFNIALLSMSLGNGQVV